MLLLPERTSEESRVIVWFSCGEASSVAAKLALAKYGPHRCMIVNCDTTKDEHPDNLRMIREVSNWLGRPIIQIRSDKFETVNDVISNRQYISGPAGAPCTGELKKRPRFSFQQPDDIHIFGYTLDEKKRIRQFEDNNPELDLDWILVEEKLTKQDCADIIQAAGIERAMMYKLGFKNNNCIGCCKAQSPMYWWRIKIHFPDVFNRRVRQSRLLGVRMLVKVTKGVKYRLFLDELTLEMTKGSREPSLGCGPECVGLTSA